MPSKKNEGTKAKVIQLMIESLGMEVNAILQYQTFAMNAKLGDYRSAKVGELFAELAADETGDLKKFMEWIINLGGAVKASLPVDIDMTEDPVKMLHKAIEIEKEGVKKYREIIATIKEDPASLELEADGLFHLINHIIIDEEEHIRKCNRLLPL